MGGILGLYCKVLVDKSLTGLAEELITNILSPLEEDFQNDIILEEVDVGDNIEESGGSHPVSQRIELGWSQVLQIHPLLQLLFSQSLDIDNTRSRNCVVVSEIRFSFLSWQNRKLVRLEDFFGSRSSNTMNELDRSGVSIFGEE